MTPRWTQMRDHQEQERLINSLARFKVVPAGRRSGKTELIGKRKILLRAILAHDKRYPEYYRPFSDPRFFVAAPTRDQVKRIYWSDLKQMVPKEYLRSKPNESQLILSFINGSELHLLGMDKPERIEGSPWDHGVLDEFGNMKKKTWGEHVRPALSDRQGGCDFIGVPEGRNHYFDTHKKAKARYRDAIKKGLRPEWDTFWWPSKDILAAKEIEAAMEDLDELTFDQEYNASFVNFTGRAYYSFLEQTHCRRLFYDPHGDILLMFDFNVAPGVAAIGQEQILPENRGIIGTGIIGEVWVPRGSNTEIVTRRIIKDWGKHKGRIFVYGDYTGGAKGTASLQGSDWEIIRRMLYNHFGPERVIFRVKVNPRERDRINSVNSRLLSVDGKIRMMVDPDRAPHIVDDFEGTVLIDGGSGEIDKTSDPDRSHITDAIGYYVWVEHPVKRIWAKKQEKYWK